MKLDQLPNLATIPAPRDPADPRGFAPGQVPVNDETRPCTRTADEIRAAILRRTGRTRLHGTTES
ncbi:hypothetical protein [Lysobacter olei]